jgi:GNAT acetyltransferase-like protein
VAERPTLEPPRLTRSELQRDSVPWANSIFEQPWWLDCVAPGAWSDVVIRRGGEVVGRLPYAHRSRFGLETIVRPPYTQTLGPWLATGEGKYARRLENENRLLGELIQGLPPFDIFRQSFSTSLTNWLPFYWTGFQATVRYTYRIEDLSDLDRVQSDFQEHVRRSIRKAQRTVELVPDCPLDELLRLNAQTYARRGRATPHSDALVRRLDAACAARGAGRILGAVDARGRMHATLFVVWDDRTMYALINGRDAELQTSGANSLLYWEAIRLAARVSRVFDFEGSMVEPIARFFRAFGGRQTPYLLVTKAHPRARPALAAWSVRQAAGRLRRRG